MIPAFPPTPAPIVTPSSATSASSRPGISERSLLGDRIDQIVADAKSKTGGTLGVVVWDLGTNVLVQTNAEQAFPMASVVKLAIAFAAYQNVDRGKLHLDARTRELIARTLIENDDAASETLARMLGGTDAVNAALRDANVDAVVIQRGPDSVGSPAAIALLLSEILRGSVLSPGSRTALLDQLALVKAGATRLRAGLPVKIRLRHKTGTSSTSGGVIEATNDVGIATVNGRDVIIVAMLQGAGGTSPERDALIADVARAATDATRVFPL